ncbi:MULTISPECIES: ABC transporter permease [Desulfobacula]|uniref:Predicted oligopeptide/dipeptide ABC transporter, permease protein n=2 Tax=Desulfobacula TaxID=28222 RepID=K0NCA5_DESTT|nr:MULTISPECIES: ABC transporter permease [Desulfobacula]CCK82059.1 predicted oligopeptide/dipeptide ABC transporter, permease protein [Desulfobacula toluolica Tol2]SDU47269.1 peptide/nickel transport system permease protein [Desulfobacula phenolica]
MHKNGLKETIRDPLFITGFFLLGFVVVTLAVGRCLTPFSPDDISFTPLSPPSWEHLLGINDGGQDIFSELVFAVGNSLGFGLLCGGTTLFIAIFAGLFAAWYQGIVDQVIMRVCDILLSIPSIMILIFIAALFRPPPFVLALVLSFMSWPTLARSFRAQGLTLRKSLHVQAASQMGAGAFYIIKNHLVPELFPLYLIGFAGKMRMAMFMEATLAFLGLFDPSRKSLGMMISYALKYYYMDIWWNWFAPPVAFLSIMIMSVTFMAISMEKAFDPRIQNTMG